MGTDDLQISQRVRELMDAHGVPKRSQAKELARILAISYSAATRKIKGQLPWKLEQIGEVASAFGEPASVLLGAATTQEGGLAGTAQEGQFVVGGRRFACLLWRAEALDARPAGGDLVAVDEAGQWLVYPVQDAPTGGQRFDVERIEIVGRHAEADKPLIAVVDDSHDIAESICDYFNARGLRAQPYYGLQSFREALETEMFDGFVLDWLFGNETAADVIGTIRESEDEEAPIFLLTGELVTGNADENDIAGVIERYDVACVEKPVRPSLLLAELSNKLGVR
ncbi:helix-turn-helix domain-containing protein [Trinickia fusca]|uniref:Response regulator n=1 Tax=Trinickia fusca TaxID=2419777 RepID=A0A494XNI9_9BURK|nr:helix-turn-helix domain-containing protein [Trinickia fusca]RKP52237.1 response regulator [Trinickia fusca]